MLVLTRKRGETINIGSNIIIHIVKTSQGSVKIGIDAPKSVRVTRGEVVTVQDPDDFTVEFGTDDETMEPCMLEAMLVQS